MKKPLVMILAGALVLTLTVRGGVPAGDADSLPGPEDPASFRTADIWSGSGTGEDAEEGTPLLRFDTGRLGGLIRVVLTVSFGSPSDSPEP